MDKNDSERVYKLLLTYGQHIDDCKFPDEPCSCGFMQALLDAKVNAVLPLDKS